MFIKSIIIDGVDGDIEMVHVDETPSGRGAGVLVMELTESKRRDQTTRRANRTICMMEAKQSDEEQFAAAIEVTKAICGVSRGKVNATNSMIHEVWREMQRVAGC